ncbi:MAG: ribA/ribD-fused uncharacterized protein [Maribacter sp.]|jgi:ribA/ribD-fused uncharacterized protein
MKYNLDWLIDKNEKDEQIKYLFFWGHTPNKDGSVGKSCFSQWWEEPFTVDGKTYLSAEHWMMVGKAKLFDVTMVDKVLSASSPDLAKKLGRQIKNFDSKLWNEEKYEIVKQGNIHKFSQNEEIKTFLLRTNDRILVEASPYDKIWGIGMSQNNDNSSNPALWKGENLLGFALMEARYYLKS